MPDPHSQPPGTKGSPHTPRYQQGPLRAKEEGLVMSPGTQALSLRRHSGFYPWPPTVSLKCVCGGLGWGLRPWSLASCPPPALSFSLAVHTTARVTKASFWGVSPVQSPAPALSRACAWAAAFCSRHLQMIHHLSSEFVFCKCSLKGKWRGSGAWKLCAAPASCPPCPSPVTS